MPKKKQQDKTKAPKITKGAPELTEKELAKVSGGGLLSNLGDIKGESSDDKHKDWIG